MEIVHHITCFVNTLIVRTKEMTKYRIKEKMVWNNCYKMMRPEYRPQSKWFGLIWLPIYDGEFFALFESKGEAERFIKHEIERKTKQNVKYHDYEAH